MYEDPTTSALLPTTQHHLLARTARAQRETRTPGLLAGVVRDGRLVWSAARGEIAEPHTDVQHRIGSITKTVTAIAVMRLRDEGLLTLDDPLEQHLPGTPLGSRTVGQLLSHTAGVGAESPGGWWERTPGQDLQLSDADVVGGAGRRFHYSNLGYGLLGSLLARARARSWGDVVTDEVLLPLGMTRTTPRPSGSAARGFAVHPWADVVLDEPEHHHGAMAPAGQLWATLTDLARLATFLLGDTGDVLSADTLTEMCVPAGFDSDSDGLSAYGLGVQSLRLPGKGAGERTLVGHGGSMPGFLAGVFVDQAAGEGVLTMRNTTTGPDGGLTGDLFDLLRQHEPAVGGIWSPSAAAVDLDLLGPWFWGPAPYVLTARGNGLLHLSGLGRQGRTARFRRRGDSWVGLDGYFSGEVITTLTKDLMVLATFTFTRTAYAPDQPVPGGVTGWR